MGLSSEPGPVRLEPTGDSRRAESGSGDGDCSAQGAALVRFLGALNPGCGQQSPAGQMSANWLAQSLRELPVAFTLACGGWAFVSVRVQSRNARGDGVRE